MSKKLSAIMLLGVCLSMVGVLLLISVIRMHSVDVVDTPPSPTVTNSRLAITPVSQNISGIPRHLIIPSLNLNLPIIPGYYDPATGQWTLTRTNVQFATMTSEPNTQSGSTFIYGHALSNVFGSLPKLQSGSTAIITTDNNHSFFYTLASTKVVSPADSAEVLQYTGKPILTLQTCVGLLYQSRELLTFDFQRAT